jgi:hypothetical protein
MTIQNPIVLLFALVISCCQEGVGAWVSKGSTPTFPPMLSSTSHNLHRRSAIESSSPSPSRRGPYSKICDKDNKHDYLSYSSSRRSFFEESQRFLLLPAATLAMPFPANAKYGKGTSMELPSYIDYLIEKNTAADNSEALYKGADPATVLRRLAESERRLGEVAELAEKKKWSQINGLVTGPLGTLSSSMNQIVSIASSSATPKKKKEVEQAVKKVKADILGIGQAADRKNGEICTQQAQMASVDLKALLEIAFE